MALIHNEAVFFSCVLDNREVARDLVDGYDASCNRHINELINYMSFRSWENMSHLFVDLSTKEELKALFKFSEVPFCLVIDEVILNVF